ncbi:MAG: DUF349 domain-containing protein [Nocardioidaceae bacterium]
MTEQDRSVDPWGRIDDTGTVYVRTRDGERVVGQWPDGDPVEALALYTRRFDGLAVEVDLLVRRVGKGALSPDEATKAIASLRDSIAGAQVVGDLDSLGQRLDTLGPLLDEQRAKRRADRAAAQSESRTAKEALVAEAERLAEGDDWRAGSDRLRELLTDWKALARLDKSTDDALWHRFSSARTIYTRRRKAYFAEVHEKRDAAGVAKAKLAARAEELATSSDWGPTAGAFRDLMREWKAAGPAPRGAEARLWARFRGAQDSFFGARDAENAKTDAEYSANAQVKLTLLAQAETLLPVTDVVAARSAFRDLSDRWDAAGKVPRAQMRDLEGRMRAVEQTIAAAEQDRWQRSNPEARARAEDAVRQLEEVLAGLQGDREKADAAGDAKGVRDADAAIEARRSWLDAARTTLADFT